MSSITPLAQLQIANGLGERYGTAAIAAALAFAVIFGLLILFVSRYRRCPANKILVISGSVGGAFSQPIARARCSASVKLSRSRLHT